MNCGFKSISSSTFRCFTCNQLIDANRIRKKYKDWNFKCCLLNSIKLYGMSQIFETVRISNLNFLFKEVYADSLKDLFNSTSSIFNYPKKSCNASTNPVTSLYTVPVTINFSKNKKRKQR